MAKLWQLGVVGAVLPSLCAAADPTPDLSEIIVTGSHISDLATKTDTALIETPQSISVLSSELLDLRGVERLQEALRYTAGVAVEEYGFDTRYDYFFIRGFEAELFGNYRDGLHQPCGSATCYRTEPYGLDSIEILKGPSSVLYGQNAPGGLVNTVSKRPLDTPLHEVELEVGNFNRVEGKLDFSDRLDSNGVVDYRLTAVWRNSDTQVADVVDDRTYVAPALTWHITDGTSLTLLTQYLHDRTSGNPFFYTLPDGTFTGIRTGDPALDRYEQTQYSVGYEFKSQFNDTWKFVQNFRWSHIKLLWDYVEDNGLEADNVTLDRIAGLNNENQDAYALDNQVQAAFETGAIKHRVLVGADLSRTHYIYYAGYGDAPSIDLLDPVYNSGPVPIPAVSEIGNQTQQQVGVYFQDQLKFSQWIVTAGGREDHATSDTGDLIAQAYQNQSDNHFSGRVGLGYAITDKIIPYLSYSTSFQLTPGVDFYQNPFKPSTGKQLEGGIKYEPTVVPGLITVSLYDLQQQNVLTQDPDPAHAGYSVQTGAIRSAGAEVEASVKPTSALNLTASYSYDQARVTSSNGPDEQKVPPVIPKHQATLFADYTFAPDRLDGVLGGGGGVRYVGMSYADQIDYLTNTSTTLFDLQSHYDWHGWRVALNVDNLFDKRSFVCSYAFCSEGLQRTVIGSVRRRW